jgi:uncharacterized integral membrane protein
MVEQPQVQMQRAPKKGRGRLIVVGVIAVLVLIFILQNGADTQLNYLWFDFTWPAWLLIVLSLIVGVIAGLLIGAYARHSRRR